MSFVFIACDNAASGIGDPYHTIPDYRMTATTSYSGYDPRFARTLNLLAWIPSGNDKEDFLQVMYKEMNDFSLRV